MCLGKVMQLLHAVEAVAQFSPLSCQREKYLTFVVVEVDIRHDPAVENRRQVSFEKPFLELQTVPDRHHSDEFLRLLDTDSRKLHHASTFLKV